VDKTDGDKALDEESIWRESERKFRVEQRRQNQVEWVHYYRTLANRHYASARRCLELARQVELLMIDGRPARKGGIWSRYVGLDRPDDDDGPPEAA